LNLIFTSIGSVTRRFKVYNINNKAINISEIKLSTGNSSPFTLSINGEEGKAFNNQVIFGGDSMLVLAKALIDQSPAANPFIVEDQVQFSANGNNQQVKLLAWGQNAHFLNDSILAPGTTWLNDKPYVIINSILVDSLSTLTIEKGVRIFLHPNSNFFVGGSLVINGTSDEKITFTNDRLDEPYKSSPGQWNGIFFLEGSKGNKIDNAIIKNAQYGIWLGTPDDNSDPDLILSNSIIENITNAGLICFTSDLSAYNIVINNCGQYALANLAGGNYDYTHITLANYGFDFLRNVPSIVFSDNLELADGSKISADLNVSVINSILWGSLNEELLFDLSDQNSQFGFRNNLIRTQIDTFQISNLVNMDPGFILPESFNYKIDSFSPAIDAGILSFVSKDIEGKLRGPKPDLGAYEIIY